MKTQRHAGTYDTRTAIRCSYELCVCFECDPRVWQSPWQEFAAHSFAPLILDMLKDRVSSKTSTNNVVHVTTKHKQFISISGGNKPWHKHRFFTANPANAPFDVYIWPS